MMNDRASPPRVSASPANHPLATAAAKMPAIEWPAPVVHNVTDALEDLACSLERLNALHRSNNGDLCDYVDEMADSPERARIYDCWMIFVTVAERIKATNDLVNAIVEKVYADRRAA